MIGSLKELFYDPIQSARVISYLVQQLSSQSADVAQGPKVQAKRLTKSYGFGRIRSKPIRMPQISARVSEELADQIEAYSDETGEAKSETIRTLLQQGLEYEDVANENERLRAQLAAANQRIDANNELVEYIEEARSLVSEHKLVCSRD